jgi:hypothetical protein
MRRARNAGFDVPDCAGTLHRGSRRVGDGPLPLPTRSTTMLPYVIEEYSPQAKPTALRTGTGQRQDCVTTADNIF